MPAPWMMQQPPMDAEQAPAWPPPQWLTGTAQPPAPEMAFGLDESVMPPASAMTPIAPMGSPGLPGVLGQQTLPGAGDQPPSFPPSHWNVPADAPPPQAAATAAPEARDVAFAPEVMPPAHRMPVDPYEDMIANSYAGGAAAEQSANKQAAIMDDAAKQADAQGVKDEQAYQAEHAKVRGQLDEVANSKIDPDHWWGSRSTGQQVSGYISAAIAGFLSPRGPNSALEMINRAIDRDVESQVQTLGNKRAAAGMAMQDANETAQHATFMRAALLESAARKSDVIGKQYEGTAAGLRAKDQADALRLDAAKAAAALAHQKAAAAGAAQARKDAKSERDRQYGLETRKLDIEEGKLNAKNAPGVVTFNGQPLMAGGTPEATKKAQEVVAKYQQTLSEITPDMDTITRNGKANVALRDADNALQNITGLQYRGELLNTRTQADAGTATMDTSGQAAEKRQRTGAARIALIKTIGADQATLIDDHTLNAIVSGEAGGDVPVGFRNAAEVEAVRKLAEEKYQRGLDLLAGKQAPVAPKTQGEWRAQQAHADATAGR